MKTALVLATMISSILLVSTAYALVPMGSLVITVNPEKSPIESNEIPAIVGTVTNQASKPVDNAQISISTASGVFYTTTDSDGKFRYQYPDTVSPAEYLVNIKAQKDGYRVGLGSTTFFVSGVPAQSQYHSGTISGNNTIQDPVASSILKNIEIAKKMQAEQDAKTKQIEDEKKLQEQQRALANQQLQIDLQNWFDQLNPFTPRNAYAMFVSQINQTVQSIFWGQFNFTEQKTNNGLAARDQVLQNGGTADEARNAFIQNASSSKSEIVAVNKDLNIKYGHADKDVQAKFDKYGNIPR
ncbi:MAG: carboxypeptidase-like regulatory domain-containing protein [Nitrososphaera sp.]|jgi:hypothetical protein